MKYDFEYTEKYFRKIFMNNEKIVIDGAMIAGLMNKTKENLFKMMGLK